jgi:hypothetical protein
VIRSFVTPLQQGPFVSQPFQASPSQLFQPESQLVIAQFGALQ